MDKSDYIDPKIPTGTRKFYDPLRLRSWVKENAKEAFARKLNGLESNDYRLELRDVHYPDEDKEFSLQEQKRALLEKRDLSLPLKGTFELYDKRSGHKVAEKRTIIAQIPYVTDRNTSIINGSE